MAFSLCVGHYKNTEYCSNCLCTLPGIITSPGYPEIYPNDIDLHWLIQVPDGKSIEMEFAMLDIEDGYGIYCW